VVSIFYGSFIPLYVSELGSYNLSRPTRSSLEEKI
jgi:hypothetical protein